MKHASHRLIIFSGSGDQLSLVQFEKGNIFYPYEFAENLLKTATYMGEINVSSYDIPVYHLLECDLVLRRERPYAPVIDLIEGQDISLGQGAYLCWALGLFWGEFYSKKSELLLPNLMAKNLQFLKKDSEVTFFGGSFYPWHKGHSECLNLCPDDSIIVVPDSNPWKDQSSQIDQKYWERFKEICCILKDTPYGIFPGFWGMPKGNPTVKWFPSFSLNKKNLLLGADTFLGLLKWTDVESLLQVVDRVYVVPRLIEKAVLLEQKEKILSLYPSIKIDLLSSHPYEHISSTAIRDASN